MKINDRWEVLSDSFNFILREHYVSEKEKSKGNARHNDRYFPTMEQALQCIVTETGKGCETIEAAIEEITTVRNDIVAHVKTCSRSSV